MEANQDGSVIVCACDDLMLMVVDIEVGRVIRRFSGHKNKITDVAFRLFVVVLLLLLLLLVLWLIFCFI